MSAHYYRNRLYRIEPLILEMLARATPEQQRAFHAKCERRWAGAEEESKFVIEQCVPVLQVSYAI